MVLTDPMREISSTLSYDQTRGLFKDILFFQDKISIARCFLEISCFSNTRYLWLGGLSTVLYTMIVV